MDARTDENLMADLAQGDIQALAPLYVRYGGAVTAMLRRRVRGLSPDEADDLAQEAFLTVLDTASRYRHNGRLKAWILGIAAGLARNRVRTTWSRVATLARHMPPVATEADGTLRRIHARRQVERALDALTDDDREVIVLHVIEGLSAQEVSEALGIRPNAFYVRLHRARKKMMAAMAEGAPDGL